MMTPRTALAALCALVSLGTSPGLAQPDFTYTVIVDPTATESANYTTIQGAINNGIPDDPTVRYTVLIYAGVYEEEVTLGDTRENVDLVGVDPDAVIIRPPLGDNGVIISGFGARNNSIRNLTIEIPDDTGTGDDLDGILLTKPGSGDDPSGITIENVTIRVDADASRAIGAAVRVRDLLITGATITTTGEDTVGIELAGGSSSTPNEDITVEALSLVSTGDAGHGISLDHETERFTLRDADLTLSGHLAIPVRFSGSLAADSIVDPTFTRVCIRHTNQVNAGIQGGPSLRMTITDCDLYKLDGHGIIAGNDTHITNTTTVTRKVTAGPGDNDNAGVSANGTSGLRIENSFLEGRLAGVQLKSDCSDVIITNSILYGSHYGLRSECGDRIEVSGCSISGDSSRGQLSAVPQLQYHGVSVDDKEGCEPGVIVFTNCEIEGRSLVGDIDAHGVYIEAAPGSADGPVRFEGCVIRAEQGAAAPADPGRSFGARADEADSITLVGGTVSSVDIDERETDQYDLRGPDGGTVQGIAVAGTEFSKWYGPVGAAVAPSPMVQRTITVPAASNTGVNGPTTLTGSEQTITGFITQPQGYRVLKLTLSQTQGADFTAIVIGDNAAGERIADAIEVSAGQTSAQGAKPFLGVTKIILPAGSGTASIGTTDILGLEFPVASGAAVQQQGKMASAGTAYTIGAPGTVYPAHATVDAATITTGDSFEWAIRASR
ncbi:MAG: right-handed parallel beta-helix repeat-containing protein [Phycisphaerales bacterium]|nr:right-handed parallel beta-helix repeat-containing protein [Phycisphaerales bacterium]